jgi:hypothetical protein
MSPEPAPAMPWGTRILIGGVLAGALGVGAYTYGRLGFVEEAAHRKSAEIRATEAEKSLEATERVRKNQEKDLLDRLEGLQKRIAELEAAGRQSKEELHAARTELERSRRQNEDKDVILKAMQGDLDKARLELDRVQAERSRVLEKAPAAGPKAENPPAVPPKAEAERPPPRGLGETAVTDPNQVRKVLDALNGLLADVAGKERFKVASAEAVDGDRLVRVRIEVRDEGGEVVKSFQAAEARFVLSGAAGTLGIRMKDGAVTYGGNRTVPFPEGAYTALLVVDPAPFRASGNPLIAVQ